MSRVPKSPHPPRAGMAEPRRALVSIDAIGSQTLIAALIRAKGGDCLLALKDNHPAVLAEMEASLRRPRPRQAPRGHLRDRRERPRTPRTPRLTCLLAFGLVHRPQEVVRSGLRRDGRIPPRPPGAGKPHGTAPVPVSEAPVRPGCPRSRTRPLGHRKRPLVLDIAFDEDASCARTDYAPKTSPISAAWPTTPCASNATPHPTLTTPRPSATRPFNAAPPATKPSATVSWTTFHPRLFVLPPNPVPRELDYRQNFDASALFLRQRVLPEIPSSAFPVARFHVLRMNARLCVHLVPGRSMYWNRSLE